MNFSGRPERAINSYARYFGLFKRTMWVEAGVPIAGLSGSVSGTRIQGSINGAGDSSYQAAMLLKGGPALTVEQFENYKPTTTLGVSFTLTAPSGQYNANKVLIDKITDAIPKTESPRDIAWVIVSFFDKHPWANVPIIIACLGAILSAINSFDC